MREVKHEQLFLGEIAISEIKINLKSRDDVPKILLGIQHVYNDKETRKELFEVLETIIPPQIDKHNGRPGLELWRLFVLSMLRVHLNWDFDRLEEMANNHKTIRQMLGHTIFDDDFLYERRTLHNNFALLTPEILDKLNQIIIKAGHKLVKKEDQPLGGKCDSFVVETDVHFPTDINLLFDAIRKIINFVGILCDKFSLPGWRQYKYNIKQMKKLYRKAQNTKKRKATTENQENKKVIVAHKNYIEQANMYIVKAKNTIAELVANNKKQNIFLAFYIAEIENYIMHAERQIDQIIRRVLNEEKIPHSEKVFSIFEPYTEWINKGKEGVSVELGLKVCIMSDQYGFILYHKVMQKQTDEQVAISMVQETQNRFSNFVLASFDRGFYSARNKLELSKNLDCLGLPKKGYKSNEDIMFENSEQFKKARNKHSRVESDINALEVHGLNRCLDTGLPGFKRYVAVAITARNLQIIGKIIRRKSFKQRRKINTS